MKTLLAILIATSLTANAWLVLRSTSAADATAEPTSAKSEAAPPQAAEATGSVPLAALEASDPAACRDQLRAAGADETMVRSIVEGVLRRRYREQLTALRIERNQTAWWRSDARATSGYEAQLLNEIVRNPLREFVGRDPLELRDAENRFTFLPPAKRRLLAEIALDYADMDAAAGGRPSVNSLRSEVDQQQLLAQERRKDVLAALTPEERAEYDLRFEGSAGLLSGRLAVMNGTEQEFRALRPVLDEIRQREQSLSKGEGFSAAYAELTQQALDEIAAAIGPDRALDYQWSGPGLYAELVRFAQDKGLPPTTAARVMQLAAETGARASATHHDATIPPDEKRAALQALQASVRMDFDRLVPEALRAELPEQAVGWFAMLADGRYMGFMPSLTSTGSGTIAPISITSPAGGRASSPPPRPRSLAK